MLQCVAVCCSGKSKQGKDPAAKQVCCSVLQSVAVCCRVLLQWVAVGCSGESIKGKDAVARQVYCRVLYCATVCDCVAVCYSVLQSVAVWRA